MKTYYVIGENTNVGEKILFSGSLSDCIGWIWDNCDIGDLYNRCAGRWSGYAYYEEDNQCYAILVDKFYGLV